MFGGFLPVESGREQKTEKEERFIVFCHHPTPKSLSHSVKKSNKNLKPVAEVVSSCISFWMLVFRFWIFIVSRET